MREFATFDTKECNKLKFFHSTLILTGPGPPGRQYYCKILLYANMLIETETEKTIVFYRIFIFGGM